MERNVAGKHRDFSQFNREAQWCRFYSGCSMGSASTRTTGDESRRATAELTSMAARFASQSCAVCGVNLDWLDESNHREVVEVDPQCEFSKNRKEIEGLPDCQTGPEIQIFESVKSAPKLRFREEPPILHMPTDLQKPTSVTSHFWEPYHVLNIVVRMGS